MNKTNGILQSMVIFFDRTIRLKVGNWAVILSLLLISKIGCYAQKNNQIDSVKHVMKEFLDSVNVRFQSNCKFQNILVIPYGKIKIENQVYYIYVFGSKLDLHKSIKYVLFYNGTLIGQNKILGHDGFDKDIKFLNAIYKQSKKFKSKTYINLIDLLVEDYTYSKEGYGVPMPR